MEQKVGEVLEHLKNRDISRKDRAGFFEGLCDEGSESHDPRLSRAVATRLLEIPNEYPDRVVKIARNFLGMNTLTLPKKFKIR